MYAKQLIKHVANSKMLAILILTFSFNMTAHAADTWASCTPNQVMTYSQRIHVRCASAIGKISYFALSTQNAQLAARTLSVISTAQVAGRTLTVLYDPADLTGASIGCLTSDCRLIHAIGFGQ
jgi:hypothetical protein